MGFGRELPNSYAFFSGHVDFVAGTAFVQIFRIVVTYFLYKASVECVSRGRASDERLDLLAYSLG